MRARLLELAGLFLKLGCIGFGGPAAHIGLMDDEVVRRRSWLSREQFLDLLSAVNLIPGPNSTEMAMHVGWVRAGFPGLFVAGVCFILPAMGIVMACAWAYVSFGSVPQVAGLLQGVKPVVMAIILQAVGGFGRTILKTPWAISITLAALVLAALGYHELLILFGAGLVMVVVRLGQRSGGGVLHCLAVPLFSGGPLLSTVLATAANVAGAVGLGQLLLVFLKIGSVLYGSGYVLLAYLRADVVERYGWLTETQLLDAIAVGQFTPGPLLTTATFIGYVAAGFPGGIAATIGIFLPAFIFVSLSGPLIPRLRQSPLAGAFLDGVQLASLALMVWVTIELASGALVRWDAVALTVLSLLLLGRCRMNSVWLILGGAVYGLLTGFP